MTQATFVKCIWLFFKVLDGKWDEAMSCPHCGTLATAPALVCDGTHVGPAQPRINDHRWVMQTAPISSENPVRVATDFSDRVCIADKLTRLAILEFTTSSQLNPVAYAVTIHTLTHITNHSL